MSLRRATLPLVVAAAAVAAVTACTGPTSFTAAPSAPTASQPPAAQRTPVIIDTDLDVSDVAAVAILLLDPSLDVRAVTIAPTGTGVTNCASGRAVMRYVLDELGRSDVPFACGRTDAGADAIPFPPEWRTAADTGWGIDMPARPQNETPESVVDLFARAVADSPSAPTVVALGPWTNLEDTVAQDPTNAQRIVGIHAMAGAVDAPGNVFTEDLDADDRLEWNVAADPSAFVAVFQAQVPITIVPLDATDDVPMKASFVDGLADAEAAGANLIYELMVRVPERVSGDGQQLWDELAALAFTAPDLVTWEEAGLTVQANGRLDRDPDGRSVRVATAADASAAETAFLDGLARGPARTARFELQGEVAATFDGTTCTAEPVEPLRAGPARLTFENTSGAPARVAIIGIDAAHAWSDVEALARDPDVLSAEPPDWIVLAGTANDATGDAEITGGTVVTTAGTNGPVCIGGTWPDATLAPGIPFEVAAAP